MARTWEGRRPGEQRSPYESIGRGGKDKIERPQATSVVQGCGDPNCPTCMPKGNPAAAGGALGGSPRSAWNTVERAVLDQMERRYSLPEFMFDITIADANPASPSPKDPATAARTQAAADERRLRPKVERFMLKTEHAVGWDDVVGNALAREALVEAIEQPVRFADLYAHYGMRAPKGVLLYGPPGCGKTMFGKAAAAVLAQLHKRPAGETTLLSIKGPEIQSPYVGVTEELIRDVFAYARAYRALHGIPLVVFIDEADAILPSRDGSGTGRRALSWEESNVATFLTEMDGLEDSGAFVILATNRPHAIDAALLRDGRCDRKIKVERPTEEAAAAILRKALQGAPLAPSCTVEDLATGTAEAVFSPFHHLARVRHQRGVDQLRLGDIVSGAMLVGLVAKAKGNAFRRDLAAGGAPAGLTEQDLEAAVLTVLRENRGLSHGDALQELAELNDWEIRAVEPVLDRPTIDVGHVAGSA